MKTLKLVAVLVAVVVASACGGNPISSSSSSVNVSIDPNMVSPPSDSVLVVGDSINASYSIDAPPPLDYAWVLWPKEGGPWLKKCGALAQSGSSQKTHQAGSFTHLIDQGTYEWAKGLIRLEFVHAPAGLCSGYFGDRSKVDTLLAGAVRVSVGTWSLAQIR